VIDIPMTVAKRCREIVSRLLPVPKAIPVTRPPASHAPKWAPLTLPGFAGPYYEGRATALRNEPLCANPYETGDNFPAKIGWTSGWLSGVTGSDS
jgi:hypothetical protein